MKMHGPEEYFRHGMYLLRKGQTRDALPFFSG